MKNVKNLFLGLLLSSVFVLSSCSSSAVDEAVACSNQTQIEAAIDKVTTTQNALLADPTSTVNCAAYKDAINEMIAQVEACPAAQVELASDLATVKAALAQLPC